MAEQPPNADVMMYRKPTRDAVIDSLTAEALHYVEGFERDDYDESSWYGNPAQDQTNGQDFNWTNNLAPDNSVRAIRSYEDLAEGVAEVALAVEAACYDYSPDSANITDDGFIGIVKAVAGRFGYGAVGERFFAHSVKTYPARPGDEEKGIDVRSVLGATAQVKTMEKYRNKSKKGAEMLVWVQPGDEWTWEVKK